MENPVVENGGLCGFDRFSFPVVEDQPSRLHYQEHSRLELAAIKAILAAEGKSEYDAVDFSQHLNITKYDHLGMTRGEHLFSMFSGEFRGKKKYCIFIYVVLRTEAKSDMQFNPKLFARSFPTVEHSAGRWMNTLDVWEFVDTSIIKPVTVLTTD